MKIIPLAVFLFLVNLHTAFCPNTNELPILKSRPIIEIPRLTISYDVLIDAIYQHESRRNPEAYNPKEIAVGGLQIRPCRLEHYNKLTGKDYKLNDMFDFEKAKEIFMYFTNHNGNGKLIHNKSWEKAAKDWNGSGPLTITYWERGIKPLLNI